MVIAGSGKIGLLERKKRQATGTVSTIIRVEQGVFKLICEEHGHTVMRHSYGTAMSSGSHPEQFCPQCREAMGLPAKVDPFRLGPRNPNAGICDGCASDAPTLVTLKHLDIEHSMQLCGDCMLPGSTARKRWGKRVERAAQARQAAHKGPTRAERRKMRKRINDRTGAAAGKPASGAVALLEEGE